MVELHNEGGIINGYGPKKLKPLNAQNDATNG